MVKLNLLFKLALKLVTDNTVFALLVLIELIWLYFYLYPNIYVTVYLLRDIERSFSITNGAFPWVGSDTWTGGFTAGSTFYFLIWPAVWISNANIAFVIIYSLILKTLSQIFSSVYLKKYFKIPKCFSYLIFGNLFSSYENFRFLANSSFTIILVPIILYLFYRFLILKSNQNYSIIAFALSFLVGCTTHVHITMWYLLFVLVIIVFNRYRNNLIEFIKIFSLICIAVIISQGSYLTLSFVDQTNPFATKAIFYFNFNDQGFFFNQYQYLFNQLLNLNFYQNNIFWENLIIFLISILVVINEFFFKPRKASNLYLRDISIFLFIAYLISLPYLVLPANDRYLLVLNISILLIFLVSTRTIFKRYKFTYILVLSLLLFYYKHSHPTEIKYFYNDNQVDISSAKIICNFFNKNKISFKSFVNNTFEVLTSNSNNTFWNAKFCFNSIDSDNATSLEKRYIILQHSFYDKSTNSLKAQIILPKEIKESLGNSPQLTEAVTPNYRLISYVPKNTANLQKFSRLSNITFSYELDPGLSLNHQLNKLNNSFKTGSNEPVNIYEAKLCNSPLYCSVYVFSQRQGDKLKIFIISRILQTIYLLPPVAAALNNLEINSVCDDIPQKILIASRIGNFSHIISSSEQKIKNFRTPVELYEPINCRTIKIESLSIDSGELVERGQRKILTQNQFPLIEITDLIIKNK